MSLIHKMVPVYQWQATVTQMVKCYKIKLELSLVLLDYFSDETLAANDKSLESNICIKSRVSLFVGPVRSVTGWIPLSARTACVPLIGNIQKE